MIDAKKKKKYLSIRHKKAFPKYTGKALHTMSFTQYGNPVKCQALRRLEESFGYGEDAAADATLQWEAAFPFFGGEQGAMLLDVLGINPLQFAGGGSIEDEGIHLIVEAERTGIEVRRADGAEEAVHHHHLAVVETA